MLAYRWPYHEAVVRYRSLDLSFEYCRLVSTPCQLEMNSGPKILE